MKVSLCSRELSKQWKKFIGEIAALVGPFLGFIPWVRDENKYQWLILTLLLYMCVYVYMYIKANKVTEKEIDINGTKVHIKYGDIFQEKGLKTINFNEYFDTIVDDVIISHGSLHGQFLDRLNDDEINGIKNIIRTDNYCKENILRKNNSRARGNKIIYKTGTAVKYKDFILVAFSNFNDENMANLKLEDYFACLINYWKNVNRLYNNKNIVLPLMGGGITRIENNPSCQEKLKILLAALKYSNLSFSPDITITIVLSENIKNKINLYELEV